MHRHYCWGPEWHGWHLDSRGMLWSSVSLRFLVFMVLEGSAAPFGGSACAGTASADGDMASAPAPRGVLTCTGFLSGKDASCRDSGVIGGHYTGEALGDAAAFLSSSGILSLCLSGVLSCSGAPLSEEDRADTCRSSCSSSSCLLSLCLSGALLGTGAPFSEEDRADTCRSSCSSSSCLLRLCLSGVLLCTGAPFSEEDRADTCRSSCSSSSWLLSLCLSAASLGMGALWTEEAWGFCSRRSCLSCSGILGFGTVSLCRDLVHVGVSREDTVVLPVGT